jgi:hypothetical protein
VGRHNRFPGRHCLQHRHAEPLRAGRGDQAVGGPEQARDVVAVPEQLYASCELERSDLGLQLRPQFTLPDEQENGVRLVMANPRHQRNKMLLSFQLDEHPHAQQQRIRSLHTQLLPYLGPFRLARLRGEELLGKPGWHHREPLGGEVQVGREAVCDGVGQRQQPGGPADADAVHRAQHSPLEKGELPAAWRGEPKRGDRHRHEPDHHRRGGRRTSELRQGPVEGRIERADRADALPPHQPDQPTECGRRRERSRAQHPAWQTCCLELIQHRPAGHPHHQLADPRLGLRQRRCGSQEDRLAAADAEVRQRVEQGWAGHGHPPGAVHLRRAQGHSDGPFSGQGLRKSARCPAGNPFLPSVPTWERWN